MEPLLPHVPTLEYPSNYMITDFMTNINQVNRLSFVSEAGQKMSSWEKLMRSFSILNPSVWVVLILLGVLSALIAFIVDYVCEKLLEARIAFSQSGIPPLDFLIWMSYSLFFAWIAAACGRWISQDAEGSGIPEMKSILSGINIFRYLSYQTLTAKCIGLISAFGSGMSIGREGPFVHIAGIIANKLMKIKWFQHIYKILGASVAGGVAATFGAPMGGVLFSIEVTATYYVVNNMWKALFTSVWCCLLFTLVKMHDVSDLLTEVQFERFEFDSEVWLFVVLGVVCGVAGATLVKFTHKLAFIRRNRLIPYITYRFPYTLTAAGLCAFCTFQAPYMQQPDHVTMQYFFSDKPLINHASKIWGEDHIALHLTIFFICKFMMTVISYTTPVPAGIFIPTFMTGAALGRLYGYIVNFAIGTTHMGVYSVVGAAALTSSVTHTLSVAVIVFELTGDMHYMLAMLIAVLMSYAIGNAIGPSIYDALLEMKGLPFLPTLRPSRIYSQRARDVMRTDIHFLKRESTLSSLAERLETSLREVQRIPILDQDMQLVADVNLSDIRKYLVSCYQSNRAALPLLTRKSLNEYFDRLSQLSSQAYVMER